MVDLYPIFMNLEDKPCLVVGGGQVALRKVEGLLEVGASIMVLSPQALPELQAMAQEGRIRLLERPFHEELVVGHWLVFCATDDEEVNRAVYEACEKSNIPANVVDYPPLCRFQVPGRPLARAPRTRPWPDPSR